MHTLRPRPRVDNEQYQTSLSNLPLLHTGVFYFLQNSEILKETPHMLISQRVQLNKKVWKSQHPLLWQSSEGASKQHAIL